MKGFIAVAAILVFNSIEISEGQSCDVFANYTMCKYPPGSGCQKIARGVTDEDEKIIIASHNVLRQKIANGNEPSQPGASNMKALRYNEKLAEVAQRWADQCIFDHDENRNTDIFPYVGQNIAGANYGQASDTTERAEFNDAITNSWYNGELPKFDSSNIDPFVYSDDYGHYTQVVWATTTDVGCGYSYYVGGDDGKYKKLMVCNYGIGGNMPDDPMYKRGQACADCPDTCSEDYPGLCN